MPVVKWIIFVLVVIIAAAVFAMCFLIEVLKILRGGRYDRDRNN